jgi:MFS family permease
MPITSTIPTRWHELLRARLGSWIGFAGAACSLVAVFAASASPIPLYELYRRTDGLSHADLSLTAVAYFVAVMAALVVLGRLSNHVGRRPVALAALVVTAVGTLVLTQVHSVGPLIAGRMLQGIGCGLASSALAAFIVDSAPTSPSWMPSAVTTGSPMVGLTVGALGSGALAECGPAPRTLVYLVAAGVLVACMALIVAASETVARAPGALAALRPQVRVPAAARGLLPAASATFVATWALGGFYQAFGPSVAADQLGTTNTLIAAVIFASLMAPSAIGARWPAAPLRPARSASASSCSSPRSSPSCSRCVPARSCRSSSRAPWRAPPKARRSPEACVRYSPRPPRPSAPASYRRSTSSHMAERRSPASSPVSSPAR